jgi:hypothetical protein
VAVDMSAAIAEKGKTLVIIFIKVFTTGPGFGSGQQYIPILKA